MLWKWFRFAYWLQSPAMYANHSRPLPQAAKEGLIDELKQMYAEWPFFQSTVDLVEMVLSCVLPTVSPVYHADNNNGILSIHRKGDPEIASRYNEVLVPEELKDLGKQLVDKFNSTTANILAVR